MKYKALATDYDGTIAHHGLMEPATVECFEQLKEAGCKVILVTGREIPDLLTVCHEPGIFDLIVGENGALLYWPLARKERLLAEAPPPEFAQCLREQGVNVLSVGQVIVGTIEMYDGIVRETIREMRLDLQVILNKGAVMVLPTGVDKAAGLKAALAELNIPANHVVAVGDAENDHPLFAAAGFSAAVANALPEVKAQANWTTPSDHGKGVRELAARMLANDL